MYSPVLVSTRTLSPSLTNNGTWITYPVSNVAGLPPVLTVSPLFILSLIPSVFVSLLSIGGYIAFGILGNYVYMKKVDTLVAQSAHLPDTAKYQFVAEKGGVNKKATMWVIIGYFILNLIINLAKL